MLYTLPRVNFFKRLIQGKIDEVKEWNDPDGERMSSPCPTIDFDGISQELHDKLLSEATAAGAVFSGETVNFDHCQFTWSYDAPSQALHITCVKYPSFFVDCAKIEQKIRELVKGAQDVVG